VVLHGALSKRAGYIWHSYYPLKGKGRYILLAAYVQQYTQHADLSAFLIRERPDIDPNTTFTFASIDNGTDPQAADQAGYV
jgi:hypothetical protein